MKINKTPFQDIFPLIKKSHPKVKLIIYHQMLAESHYVAHNFRDIFNLSRIKEKNKFRVLLIRKSK